jgi:hypothetical protein
MTSEIVRSLSNAVRELVRLMTLMGSNNRAALFELKSADSFGDCDPVVAQYSKEFLDWVDTGRLEEDTRRYYRNGWRLLKAKKLAGKRMDKIAKKEIEKLRFPGSPSNGNNALRTLRRMLNMAKEDKLVHEVPEAPVQGAGPVSQAQRRSGKEALTGGRTALEGHHRGHARHRPEKCARALPDAGRERRLRCRDHHDSGQQNRVGQYARIEEP